MSNLNKIPKSIQGKYVSAFKNQNDEKSVNWCAMGSVSVEEARKFAKNIINMCDRVEQDDWDI